MEREPDNAHTNDFEPGNDDPSVVVGPPAPQDELDTPVEEQSEDVNSSPVKRARSESGTEPVSDAEVRSDEI
ncbi:hypothetical protein GCM10027416_12360 [Okibacterium endophyticum]